MRNLKRALSLALAFVMVMSLMIVGTSAKSYTDADKIDNQVAVEILGEIGVMIGNDDGSFAPDRDVTRAEMAVLITRILYGNNLNVDQFKTMNTFTDVPDWAEGFVNLCASLDIIAGRGNGIFDPDATVTSAEAALMLSRALGYFKNNAEFGSDWALAAMKRATQVGIIGGDMVLQANAGLDRDDVAQMTFNTLTKAVPVQYNELLDVYYNVNQGVIYALEFNYLQTLGYTNFNLVYKSNQTVEYGRPATTWGIGSYKDAGAGTASGIEKADLTPNGGLIADNVRMLAKDEIITVTNTPTYVYSENTKAKDVYADLGADVCTEYSWMHKDGYTWTAFINGAEQPSWEKKAPSKNDTSKYTYTDKGSVTEIYVDDYAATVTVVEINYYLGQVSKVVDDVATVRPLSHEGKIMLNDRTFATTEFDKGDYVVFTVDYNTDNEFYVCEMMAPEVVTGEVTRVQKDAYSANSYVCLDGEKDEYYYTAFPSHMVYDVDSYDDGAIKTQHPTLNEKYNFFMTPAGFILGFQRADKAASQYLYVKDSDEELKDWVAKVILPDATEPKVDLDGDLDNTKNYAMAEEIKWLSAKETNIDSLIWDYSADSNGVYSLTYVPELNKDNTTVKSALYQNKLNSYEDGNGNIQINNGEAYIKGVASSSDFIIDKDTIFVDTMSHKAYTGYDEVPTVKNADIAYVVKDGVAEIVYIFDGDIYDENSIYFMLADTDRTSFTHDGDKYWTFDNAYVDGVKQSLNVSYDAVENLANSCPWAVDPQTGKLVSGVLYQVVKSLEDGEYITEIRYAGPETNDITGAGNGSFRISTSPEGTTVNEEKFNVNDETIFVMVEPVWSWTDGWTFDIHQADESDMYVGTDHEGYKMYADVVERDGQTAKLVYLTHRWPIANVDVTVKNLTNATVEIYGNHIDKTFTQNGSFKVQSGTWIVVKAQADEGYSFEKNPSGLYYVGRDGQVIDAGTKAINADITLSGLYSGKVENKGDKVVNGDTEANVLLHPEDGYTITGVKSKDASIKAFAVEGTKDWKVTIPAGTKPVDLELIIDADIYDFQDDSNDFKFAVSQNGKAVNHMTIGQTYQVTVTAEQFGDTYDGFVLTTNGVYDLIKGDATANGSKFDVVKIDKEHAQRLAAEGKTVYKDNKCESAYAGQDEILAAAATADFYQKLSENKNATATFDVTVGYNANGMVVFNVK